MAADEFGAIERLLKKGRRTARVSKVWQRIHDETGAGIITNNQLLFTPGDLRRLREYAKHLTNGVDPLTDTLKGTRMDLAEKTSDEKLASDSVFGALLVLATSGEARVTINGQVTNTPPGAVLSVRAEALDTEALKQCRLVIIENGSLMPHWQDIRLPTEWRDSVLLYRGHRENMRHVRKLIAEQPGENLALYYDFDPEGLEMALSMGKGTILIPAVWAELDNEPETVGGATQRNAYRRQTRAMIRLRELSEGTDWEPVVKIMQDGELAVMQEHMTVRGWDLTARC